MLIFVAVSASLGVVAALFGVAPIDPNVIYASTLPVVASTWAAVSARSANKSATSTNDKIDSLQTQVNQIEGKLSAVQATALVGAVAASQQQHHSD